MLLVYKIPTRFTICFNCWRPAVVCAANCRRIVCAVIQQSSHGVCGSFNNRRLYRRRSSGQQKLHGVCLALRSDVSSCLYRSVPGSHFAQNRPGLRINKLHRYYPETIYSLISTAVYSRVRSYTARTEAVWR